MVSVLCLIILTGEAVTTEAGSLFQYFTALTEKADPPPLPSGDGSYLSVPCRGALLGHVEWEGRKASSDLHPICP